MSFVLLTLKALLPLLAGLLLALPLFILILALWRNRSLRRRLRLLRRDWQPVFLERYRPEERH